MASLPGPAKFRNDAADRLRVRPLSMQPTAPNSRLESVSGGGRVTTVDLAVSAAEVRAPVAQARDYDADFSEWMRLRQGRLLRTAYLLCGDTHTAEDIVSTTLAKLYLAWPRIESRGAIDAYARRALVNETNSLWRRAWRRHETTRDELPEQASYDDRDEGEHAAVWRFVNTLPTKQRSVVVLRYYEQLSEAEVAQILGVSVGTVKSQCSRALASLRRTLDQHPELHAGRED